MRISAKRVTNPSPLFLFGSVWSQPRFLSFVTTIAPLSEISIFSSFKPSVGFAFFKAILIAAFSASFNLLSFAWTIRFVAFSFKFSRAVTSFSLLLPDIVDTPRCVTLTRAYRVSPSLNPFGRARAISLSLNVHSVSLLPWAKECSAIGVVSSWSLYNWIVRVASLLTVPISEVLSPILTIFFTLIFGLYPAWPYRRSAPPSIVGAVGSTATKILRSIIVGANTVLVVLLLLAISPAWLKSALIIRA